MGGRSYRTRRAYSHSAWYIHLAMVRAGQPGGLRLLRKLPRGGQKSLATAGWDDAVEEPALDQALQGILFHRGSRVEVRYRGERSLAPLIEHGLQSRLREVLRVAHAYPERRPFLLDGEALSREVYIRRLYPDSLPARLLIGAHIADGDLFVIEEDEDPPDGIVVAAPIGNGEEVTVKRLYCEGDFLRLRPENGDHEELVMLSEDVKIQGRVVYVVYPPRGRR